MSDTDYSKMTNAELDALVAEKVMGWRQEWGGDWLDTERRVRSTQLQGWRPCTDAYDSARLLRHLWESRRFDLIMIAFHSDKEGDWVQVDMTDTLDEYEPEYSCRLSVAADPNGFGCLARVALQAYEQEASE